MYAPSARMIFGCRMMRAIARPKGVSKRAEREVRMIFGWRKEPLALCGNDQNNGAVNAPQSNAVLGTLQRHSLSAIRLSPRLSVCA